VHSPEVNHCVFVLIVTAEPVINTGYNKTNDLVNSRRIGYGDP